MRCSGHALCPSVILGAQAVTLRRVKSDQYNARPIVVLPPLEVNVESLLFSEEEEAIYTAFEAKMQVHAKGGLLSKPAPLDADPSCADLKGFIKHPHRDELYAACCRTPHGKT